MNPKIKLLSHRYRNCQLNKGLSIESAYKKAFERNNKQSPEFRSKVARSLSYCGDADSPGPGEYEVSLPLVKPNIQAIQKNRNSIIVKIHQRNSPAFQSLQPRFKQPKTSNRIDNIESLGSNQQDTIHKSKKLIHPKPSQHWRSKNSIPSIQSYTVEVKHDKSINVKPKQNIKGTQWSKYLSGRRQWVNEIDAQVPGPGFYGYAKIKQTQYYTPKNSWQFRSSTLREAFDRKTRHLPKISGRQNQLQNFQKTACIHSLVRQ